MSNTSISDRWLSVEGIAEYLDVSKETVYRWLEKGSVPAYRLGKLWRFKTSEIDDWVKTGKASTNQSFNPTDNQQTNYEGNSNAIGSI